MIGKSIGERLRQGHPLHLVAYGTSLTTESTPFFWRRCGGAWVTQLRERLQREFPGQVTVTNRAGWGRTSAWGLAHLEKRVLTLLPDVVTLEFAINDADLRRRISPEASRSNLEHLIDQIQEANPDGLVILLTLNVCTGRPARFRPNLTSYYQIYRDAARQRELPLIDLEPDWKNLLASDPVSFHRYAPDGIHPNESGCRKVMLDKIAAALL